MKQQTRPFVVEIKKKRGPHVKKRSIWAGTDISAAAEQMKAMPPLVEEREPGLTEQGGNEATTSREARMMPAQQVTKTDANPDES